MIRLPDARTQAIQRLAHNLAADNFGRMTQREAWRQAALAYDAAAEARSAESDLRGHVRREGKE